jgi:hypothetical protein
LQSAPHLVMNSLFDIRSDPFVVREGQKVGIANFEVAAVSIDFYDVLPIHLAVAAAPAYHTDTSAGFVCEFCRDSTSYVQDLVRAVLSCCVEHLILDLLEAERIHASRGVW